MCEPTSEQLFEIQTWHPDDLHGLMEFIKPLWKYADCGFWEQVGDEYVISTAGWSDNEAIIAAMMSNHVWWMMFWYQSRRGGHYIFKPVRND